MKTIIGTMSGTSLDGVDAAILKTDGEGDLIFGATYCRPYSRAEKAILKGAIAAASGEQGRAGDEVSEAEGLILTAHEEAVRALMDEAGLSASEVDLVALHGQTLFHAPHQKVTVQIGDGHALSKALGIDVVFDFRSKDVSEGGEGAPLVPVFHRALINQSGISLPAGIVNIGGVANVSIVGEDDSLIAFDTGPGNALIDDWITSRTSKTFDQWGRIAGEGRVNEILVNEWLNDPYFSRSAPKSLDRNHFSIDEIDRASLADGAATLTAFSARAIAKAVELYPVKALFVTGGGAHNRTMTRMLSEACGLDVRNIEEIGADPDFVEAYAFAYLAARAEADLPISFPETTGVAKPMSGGRIVHAQD
ncbi:MAG: anhydro-N-acetylmuramic acid kinase [Pseudomonadota bacterium]